MLHFAEQSNGRTTKLSRWAAVAMTASLMFALSSAMTASTSFAASAPEAAAASSADSTPKFATPAATDSSAAPNDNSPATEASTDTAAPAPKPIVITLSVDIDLAMQRLTVKAHGKPLHSWAISSGTREFPTPTGTFRAQWMAKMWFSKKYDDAPMPHSIFFKDGAAIHATSSTGRLGSPASHGCVRLAPSHAAALYALVTKHGMASTRIAVHGTPQWREPQVASRSERGYPSQYQTTRYAPYGYAASPYAQSAPSGFVYPGDGPRYAQPRYAYSIPPVRNRVINPGYGARYAPYYSRY